MRLQVGRLLEPHKGWETTGALPVLINDVHFHELDFLALRVMQRRKYTQLRMMCIAALVIGAAATTLAVPPEMVSIVGKIEHSGWHLDFYRFSFIHLPAPVAGYTTTAEQFANVTAAVGVANLSRQGAFLSRSFE